MKVGISVWVMGMIDKVELPRLGDDTASGKTG